MPSYPYLLFNFKYYNRNVRLLQFSQIYNIFEGKNYDYKNGKVKIGIKMRRESNRENGI